MAALSNEERSRHQALEENLRSALRTVHELPDGFAFEFPFDQATYAELTELTRLEHSCCTFFDIAIILEHGNKLCWRLTGSEGVKRFIRAEFARWFEDRFF